MEFDLEQARTILELTLAEFSSIYAEFYSVIYDAVDGYLSGNSSVTGPQNKMRIAITESYNETAYLAWGDGGGKLPLDQDAQGFLESSITNQLEYSALLFQRLKLLRREFESDKPLFQELEIIKESSERAKGYSNSLKYFYNQMKVMALKDEPLFFTGLPGHETCPECEMLQDTWHKASWYVARGYVPPRGENLTCAPGGLCEHILMDKKSQLVTI